MTDAAPSSVLGPDAESQAPSADAPSAPGDEGPVRGEIYSLDKLDAHAAQLARAHGKPSLDVRARPLLASFHATRKALERAYERLRATARQKLDKTPAEEWLLDNVHVVDDQLRQIEASLPRGYFMKLPRIEAGAFAGLPRVYAIAIDFIGHTDARVDIDTLVRYVDAYQSMGALTIGELWAVPIMLRLGLVQGVRKLIEEELATGAERARADAWAARFLGNGDRTSTNVAVAVAELAKTNEPFAPAFVVQLLRRLRDHDAAVASASQWIHERCAEMSIEPDETTRLEHLKQAEAQVSIGNTITSMRAIAALDWNRFFERVSAVEHTLLEDPDGAYALTDARSRDRYRHAVEDIAERCDRSEVKVARAAIALASAHRGSPRGSHVGYYLVDEGRRALELEVGYRTPLGAWLRRTLKTGATPFYLSGIFLGTAALVAGLCAISWRAGDVHVPLLVALGVLALIPASEVAVSVVNWLVTAVLPPRLLAKLALEDGIPDEHRTLVAVPAMMASEEDIAELLEELEVRGLANPDPNLHYALLLDFPDADIEQRPGEAELVQKARRDIAALNERSGTVDRYIMMHRKRLHNPVQGRWMGWERKRGKLEELNRLLRSGDKGTFTVVTADETLLRSFRYVLTLDADTQLPRDAARRLVGTIAHPLNRAELDSTGTRVVNGYAVVQPRIGTTLPSTYQSRFAQIYGGRAGIDPYTTAVSDVYQDLFGEGVYIGKAIYDVHVFDAVLADRVPENRLLSHDLFEGLHGRVALATDIELLEDQPRGYAIHAGRQHRWVRGDWQLAEWILPHIPTKTGTRENDLSLVGRWKIFDNLRRSLLAPTLVTLLALAWFAAPTALPLWIALAVLTLATPLCARLATALTRPSGDKKAVSEPIFGDIRTSLIEFGLTITLLFDQALLMLDAIGRTLFRLNVRKNLLEWTTVRAAERSASSGRRVGRTWGSAAVSLFAGVVLGAHSPHVLPYAAPFLLAWCAAPFIINWISEPLPPRQHELTADDRSYFRGVAQKTWRFFETFVTATDHWLPPDNFQEDPKGVLAHRTSPTNIGLYLLSTIAARDFGFITLAELLDRLENTMTTMDGLERHAGHLLNWYETSTAKPLSPKYVSTVDSGNLAGHLWTLRQACLELNDSPIVNVRVLEAAKDAVSLFRESQRSSNLQARAGLPAALGKPLGEYEALLERSRVAPPTTARAWLSLLNKLAELSAPLVTWAHGSAAASDARWLDRSIERVAKAARELTDLAPWAADLDARPSAIGSEPYRVALSELIGGLDAVPSPRGVTAQAATARARIKAFEATLTSAKSLKEADRAAALGWLATLRAELDHGEESATALTLRLAELEERANETADAMRFDLVYDQKRELFSIGYDVGNGRLDASHYDLLASECRLASLIAIAKGDVPQKHWFRLGRQLTASADRRALLSWSGSMFEYLMPLLVTKSYERTLLDETYVTVIRRQREYATREGVPWGISESAYNTLDLGLTYQYYAFGVPGLGLKPGLADELVVSPYASALGAMVDPSLAAKNLRALAREGLEGVYGFYESIDYTPAHTPPGRRGVVVKVFMAHHQGMSLVAIDNVLNGDLMPRRLHSDPRMKATELLLQERVPAASVLTVPRAADVTAPAPLPDADLDAVEHVSTPNGPTPRVHLLAHGDLSTLVTPSGSGWMVWKGLDVTRWRDDAALDAWGSFCYLRDLASGDVWSTTFQPTRKKPDSYEARFATDRITMHRRDGDIETLTEIVVSPEHPAEVRRITVVNHSKTARRIELTTYAEVVLAPRDADLAHPAFGNLFVETEALLERDAVLAMRRPRASGDPTPWVVNVMAVEEGEVGALEVETSRARFIGRGRTLELPIAMTQRSPLSGTTGTVLDPVLALRRVLEIPAGGRARVAFTLALADSRDQALTLAESFRDPPAIARTFELAWANARVELRHLGISAAQSQQFQRLASAIVFPSSGLRAPTDVIAQNTRGRDGLWRYGISGDLPILLVRLDDQDATDLLREVIEAHEFWRLHGLAVDLVILDEEPSGYHQPLQDQALGVIRSSTAQGHLDQPGGVFFRRADKMSIEDQRLLQATARAILLASQGSLARQLRRATPRDVAASAMLIPRGPARVEPQRPVAQPELSFWNGLGGFAPEGREYVIVLDGTKTTPTPWSNVVANPRIGFVLSESGGTFTWIDNSQTRRLTPWSNDAVVDPSGEVVYLRDAEDGTIWSATPQPAGAGAAYIVRHGQGYTTFEHERGGLKHDLTVFVPTNDPVKISRLRITNTGARARRINVYGVVEWVLGTTRAKSASSVVTETDTSLDGVILAHSPNSGAPGSFAFFATSEHPRGLTCDRLELFGRSGLRRKPAALSRMALSGRTGAGFDPCAVFDVEITLAPGQSQDVLFVLGEGTSREEAIALARRHRDVAIAQSTLDAAVARWDAILGAVVVKTPDEAVNLMQNRWLLYQVLSCRVWARSAVYQSSGAYGFRDQLQDVLAAVHGAPEVTRAHILRAAARQFREGDVQHWWHAETGQGVRTRCSDDLVWLPYVVAHYIDATGDRGILDEQVPFLETRQLEAKEHEVFGVPNVSTETATLYEHCTRALDRGMTAGAHGLPLMGAGDWNDGMNHVGSEGKGESVWMAWFLGATLHAFIDIAEKHGDPTRAKWARDEIEKLAHAADEAWDGAWYRRGYFDDGSPLGSKENAECSIDAIAQSWAAISGIGDKERARLSMRATDEKLVKAEDKMILLFTPPFAKSVPDPGYIQAYPAGLRENGGQYTHGVVWTVMANALLGNGDHATELFSSLLPIRHSETPEDVSRYQVEPYVMAGDVYAASTHVGRGGWTWYTGSAAWMYRVGLESILGIARRGDELHIEPCIPSSWGEYEVTYKYRTSIYRVAVQNPDKRCVGVARMTLDGEPISGSTIALRDDGRRHEVSVVLGASPTGAAFLSRLLPRMGSGLVPC